MSPEQQKQIERLSSASVDHAAWVGLCVEMDAEIERIAQDLEAPGASAEKRLHHASEFSGARRLRRHLVDRWKAAHPK